MNIYRSLEEEQVIESTAGRDKGRLFIVFEVLDDFYVTVVDGKSRRLEKPKKKKIKHLRIYNKVFKEEMQRKDLLDAHIRKMLESLV